MNFTEEVRAGVNGKQRVQADDGNTVPIREGEERSFQDALSSIETELRTTGFCDFDAGAPKRSLA